MLQEANDAMAAVHTCGSILCKESKEGEHCQATVLDLLGLVLKVGLFISS